MSSMGSPGANDNGNTTITEPLLNIVNNTESNDGLTSVGTLIGEVTLPSKFLSAKNSIEIHKNKVLSSNQSLPNVVSDRVNCLSSLIHQQQQQGQGNFRTLLGKLERGSEDYSAQRSNSGQKSSKSVNWAPVLAGQKDVNAKPEGALISPQPVPVRSVSELLTAERTVTPEIQAGGLADRNVIEDKGQIKLPPTGVLTEEKAEDHANLLVHTNNSSSSVASLTKFPFQSCQHSPNALNQSRSHTSIYAENFSTGLHGSDKSSAVVKQRETVEDIVYVNYAGSVGGLDTGNCPSPVLPPTSDSDYTFMNENLDDNYKPSCLFYPPPENYMHNAAQDSFNNTASEEHIHHRDQFTENYPITHRDQYTGCDMTTLGAKDNNLDNHNYDTDDEMGDTDQQTPVLTMVNPKELPAPDPEYVARLVSEDLHPYIAKNYKKDCRTWLWKSKSQREACLARQKSSE